MNFNHYTQKSLEAVQSAQSIARANQHQELQQLHLLAALLEQEGGLTPQLLRKMEITAESLKTLLYRDTLASFTAEVSIWSIRSWVMEGFQDRSTS